MDLETSIGGKLFGPDAKDLNNDFFTIIWGNSPTTIQVAHRERGFHRSLATAHNDLRDADLIIGQNMPFDLGYVIDSWILNEYDGTRLVRAAKLPVTWDVSIAHYLMTGQRHAFPSLAEMQEIYLGSVSKDHKISYLFSKGIGADKIIAARHRCKRIWKLYEHYCYQDGSTVLLIFKKQYELAKKLGMVKLIQMHNKFMVSLAILMKQGIKVDLINTEKTKQKFKIKALEFLTQAIQKVDKYWDDPRLPPFSIMSPTHKSAILFGGKIKCKVKRFDGYYADKKEWQGDYTPTGRKKMVLVKGREKYKLVVEDVFVAGFSLPLTLTCESKIKGRYKTDTGVIHNIYKLSTNEEAKDYCRLQIEAMHYEKMVSTYLDPFLTYSIEGKLYPKFNNTAVITTRLSSSRPNLQNIPSKGELVNDIQGQFIAPEGFVCVSSDYSQLEMWVAAWNSGDEQLITDLLNGLDFHCQSVAFAEQIGYDVAYDLCKVKKEPEWELKRTKAKAVTFQKEYGAGIKKVADGTGLSVETVTNVFNALDEKYWKLKLFKEHVLETAKRNMRPSHIKYIPGVQRKGGVDGRRFNEHGYELLPIMVGNTKYYDDLIRNVGYYQTKYGQIYSFEEYADLDRDGNIRKSLSIPQTKNYTSQGGAAQIMAAVSIELMNYCLANKNDVQYISQIHDSCWFYVREESKDLIIPKLCSIMENVPYALKKHLDVDIEFKFPVECKIGTNFAQLEVYKHE